MKRLLLLSVLLSVLVSCVGRKQIEQQLHSGNYDLAISNALKKLENNKDKKRKQDYIVMLQDAYYKVVDENLSTINHLQKDGNPALFETIYDTYLDMESRQNAIKAVMPLQIDGKPLTLTFHDFSNEIVNYREKVSEYKYVNANTLLNNNNKLDKRVAYTLLEDIEHINPDYKDVRNLMDVAYKLGTDYVLVTIENQTRQIIPKRLENDLLQFDTYGLNDFWTEYHAHSNPEIQYDYAMQLQLQQIVVSPEHLNQRQLLREKQIVDGVKPQKDRNGDVVKDSLGNTITVPNIINVKARVFEINQSKSTRVIGQVIYSDMTNGHVLDSFGLDSEFIFENHYATYRGDIRALNKKDVKLLNNRRVAFPTNEQMVYDTGEDLKLKLKRIINNYSLRG
ncbi:hypothetical protein [Corallibacter sp.]|uniref:hypothetical protein n=1 Tax=Corallibacter sp. TaxID=2038084 RepID=UPI003A93A92D